MRGAPVVVLDVQQRKTLEQWAKSRSLPMRQVQRAQIILLAADGKQDLEIAAAVKVSNQKAARWRKFLTLGFPGLQKDAPRPGRTPTITPAKIQDLIRKTTQEKPANATHWKHAHYGGGRGHQREERAPDLASAWAEAASDANV